MLPLLIFPFLTGIFWALGGGTGDHAHAQTAGVAQGLNMSLPSPHFDKNATVLDKLGFYQKAALDSARKAEQGKSLPYLPVQQTAGYSKGLTAPTSSFAAGAAGTPYTARPATGYTDPNVQKVNEKLDQLKKIINQPPSSLPEPPPGTGGFPSGSYASPALRSSADMDRLEKLIESLKQSGDSAGHDPQMEKLDGMLDKIITIQHPEMMTTAESKPVRPVQTPAVASAGPDSGTVRILGPAQPAADTGKPSASGEEDGFFAFDDNNDSPPESENTIHAVVSEDQTLVSGATIKLRLTEDARVGGMTLPSDTYIYGTANLNNERLNISIKSVIEGNSIYPVNWQVFDLDGMSGIFIPGAISRDVAKESAAEGISGMGVSSLDASLGAQAANAGIQAAKDLVSKKIKLIKVSVKAGYEVLLKENKTAS
jgi:hypothetical protein